VLPALQQSLLLAQDGAGGGVHVEPALHGQLREKEDSEDFVSLALLVGEEALGEDLAQSPETLRDVIVGTREVK